MITAKNPNAVLMICLFHNLRTFHQEVITEKMAIFAAQKITVLEIICKLVYAHNDEEYQKFYQLLKQTKLKELIHYFDNNWHSIKEQWVEGLKHESHHYLHSMNNGLESICNTEDYKFCYKILFYLELLSRANEMFRSVILG